MTPNFTRYSIDFFVRLGLLKMLVAALDPQRRSTAPELITRRLAPLLYRTSGDGLTRADHLIRNSSGASWNFSLTEPNLKLILEWGKLIGLVGAGNQITERGLLLRYIMGDVYVAGILGGDETVNPFELKPEERFYFLYVNFEIDGALYFLLRRLAALPKDEPIRAKQAGRLACLSLYDLLNFFTETRSSGRVLLTIKDMRELIGRMVDELGLGDEVPVRPVVKPRAASALKQKAGQSKVKRTKTADHEAIPRFELLVDLGLLTKKVDEDEADEAKARKSWKYWVTPKLAAFCAGLPERIDPEFCWNSFATCSSILVSERAERLSVEEDAGTVARRAYAAYTEVKRRFGHTPVESVAVMTMIRALAVSKIIEVRDVHELFLNFKRNNLFSDSVRYAAGNDLEKMFIDVKPTFINEVDAHYGIRE